MAVPQQEKGYQKYAWVFPFILGIFLIVVTGVALLASAIGFQLALLNSFFGVLMIVVGWLGIRKGEKFAWYVLLWFVAAWIAYYGLGPSPPGLVVDTLAVFGLLFSYRKFFPKKQMSAS